MDFNTDLLLIKYVNAAFICPGVTRLSPDHSWPWMLLLFDQIINKIIKYCNNFKCLPDLKQLHQLAGEAFYNNIASSVSISCYSADVAPFGADSSLEMLASW